MTYRNLSRPLLVTLLLGAPLAAQPPQQQPQSGQAGPLAAVYQDAYHRYHGGDAAGTVAILEPLRDKVAVQTPVAALLAAAYLDTGRAEDAAALLYPLVERKEAGPAVLFDAARAAAALGDETKADALLLAAAELAPGSIASRALGFRRGRQGRYDDAYALLQPWVTHHPEDAEARLALAFAALESGQAAVVVGVLANLPPEQPRVALLTARAALDQGQPRDAITRLEPLAATAPPPEIARDVWWTLGEAYLQVGRAADAVALLSQHTAEPMLALKLMQAHQQEGHPERVLAVAAPFAGGLADQGAIAVDQRPAYAGIALEQGRALVGFGRWPEAVGALEAATTLNPTGAPEWMLLSQALRGAGRNDEAAAALARFRQLSAAAPASP